VCVCVCVNEMDTSVQLGRESSFTYYYLFVCLCLCVSVLLTHADTQKGIVGRVSTVSSLSSLFHRQLYRSFLFMLFSRTCTVSQQHSSNCLCAFFFWQSKAEEIIGLKIRPINRFEYILGDKDERGGVLYINKMSRAGQ